MLVKRALLSINWPVLGSCPITKRVFTVNISPFTNDPPVDNEVGEVYKYDDVESYEGEVPLVE